MTRLLAVVALLFACALGLFLLFVPVGGEPVALRPTLPAEGGAAVGVP